MADPMVKQVQEWLNQTYGSNDYYTQVAEDGVVTTKLMKGLITGLQIEIGISAPNGVFGPATFSACPTVRKRADDDISETRNIDQLVQGALWCKGYNPGGFTGIFYTKSEAAVKRFQADAGFDMEDCSGTVNPVLMKALMNTDAYVLISSGDANIRIIQQRLNGKYRSHYAHIIGLIPTNGLIGRETTKALIYAFQAEEGITTPNGVFGPSTSSRAPIINRITAATPAMIPFVRLLEFALYLNNPGNAPSKFDGVFEDTIIESIKGFQDYTALNREPNVVYGEVNVYTWASLMTSNGYADRTATACDTRFEVTERKAQSLHNAGYRIVGRYLTGTEFKVLREGEAQRIFNAGMNLFLIFQETPLNATSAYFTPAQGYADADKAFAAAEHFGIPYGTIIYFAVDMDVYDYEVTNNIIPYFHYVFNRFKSKYAGKYKVGIYGARNVCSRVWAAGFSVSSFVSDMSSGYSGNIGYRLPSDWAFDQFAEPDEPVGAGNGADAEIYIDKNIASGRYNGIGFVDYVLQESVAPDQSDIPEADQTNTHIRINRSGKAIPVYQKVASIDGSAPEQVQNVIGSIKPDHFYAAVLQNKQANMSENAIYRFSNYCPVIFEDTSGNQRNGYLEISRCPDNVTPEILINMGADGDQGYYNDYNSEGTVLVPSKQEEINGRRFYIFTTRKSLLSYRTDGVYAGAIPKGYQLALAGHYGGAKYPWLLRAYYKKKPTDTVWSDISVTAGQDSYGYIDLSFESGTAPGQRAIY